MLWQLLQSVTCFTPVVHAYGRRMPANDVGMSAGTAASLSARDRSDGSTTFGLGQSRCYQGLPMDSGQYMNAQKRAR